ncbi:peptidoglycan/LPS O-acetylase OafA/YrhL [Microvirga flocculans]|uniref:Peptidoglycan/LPS O-acetylase OafA/YrhL n=1 Tax=Microvirga flocculans TaxID=217168 RepID=A0A7W6NA56_9HYPH|nr:acyltransferase [Microvirga flocculans]MBB4042180.1 peptidoglycan/LPS O-acetylase OafA/YrhL [Microvirga flocculans]
MHQKDQSLEGLRGLASLAVVLAHFLFVFFPYLSNNMRPYPNAKPKTVIDAWLVYPPFSLSYAADAAVLVFFVLSGYVLTAKFYAKNDIELFESAAVRRYFRLALPALASVLFAWLLLKADFMGNQMARVLNTAGWPIHYYTEKVSLDYAVFIGLIGAPFFGNTALNGPLWSLQVELIGSILLFACYALFGRRSLLMTVVWFVFFANILGGRSPAVLNYVAILLGSLLHPIAGWLRRNPWVSTSLVVLGLIAVSYDNSPRFTLLRVISLPNFQPYGPDFNQDHRIFWHSLGAVFLVSGVIGARWFAALLASRIPTYLGRISFAIYLLHMPLIMSLAFWTAKAGQVLGMGYIARGTFAAAIFFGALVVLAELFTRYVDGPAIRFSSWISNHLNAASQRSDVPSDPEHNAPSAESSTDVSSREQVVT